jgi:hypothetical protein
MRQVAYGGKMSARPEATAGVSVLNFSGAFWGSDSRRRERLAPAQIAARITWSLGTHRAHDAQVPKREKIKASFRLD